MLIYILGEIMNNFWTGKSVLITGASSGIGWALVEALAQYQVKLGLLSRRLEPMQELAEKFKDSGSTFWIKSCDVKNRKKTEKAIREFYQFSGSLDVVWVNSGVGGRTTLEQWNWNNFENVLDTNLKGAIYTIIPALDIMTKQENGIIVGIGSASSMRGMAKHPAYSMSKIGLHYFMESFSVELPHIQFTIIHPGFIDTPLGQGRPGRIWLLQPDKAAQIMIKAVEKKKKILIFPFRMKFVYYLVRFLPINLYLWLSRRAVRSGKT